METGIAGSHIEGSARVVEPLIRKMMLILFAATLDQDGILIWRVKMRLPAMPVL
jgi:hypothetical protein